MHSGSTASLFNYYTLNTSGGCRSCFHHSVGIGRGCHQTRYQCCAYFGQDNSKNSTAFSIVTNSSSIFSFDFFYPLVFVSVLVKDSSWHAETPWSRFLHLFYMDTHPRSHNTYITASLLCGQNNFINQPPD